MKKVGTFLTKSKELRISDPCYNKDVWCCGTVKNCKVGEWSAFIIESDRGDWGKRIGELVAIFGNVSDIEAQDILDKTSWKDSNIDVGVDSGQCGIFDDSQYPEGETGEYGETGSFYDKCCNITLGDSRSGIIDFGVVSSSGYGDGTYTCLIPDTSNVIDIIKIIYIDEIEKNIDLDI